MITRNYVKTAFGGPLSAMTDPYFFMLVMHQLGVLTAHFHVPSEQAAALRERAKGGAKVLEWFETDITDASGDVVAHVRREVYVREKRRVTDAAAG